jgi:uncharacterized OB-fold protein
MGPRAGRDQAQAGSPDLSPVDTDGGEPRLVAGRCAGCGAVTFPLRAVCAACGSPVERELLPPRGTLWTWTTQGFEPKPPYVADGDGDFEPYGVGYVEFDGYLRVEGRLTESDPDRLRIGMPMRVVAVTRAGRTTYAFAPE